MAVPTTADLSFMPHRAVVNLSPVLRVAMEEALLLDRQGFAVPPAAQNVALQQRHYVTLADSLTGMLAAFHQVCAF